MTPALFVTDFGPMPALENDAYTESLGKLWGKRPNPSAIVIVSGHWESNSDLIVSASKKPGIVHDYSGFPPEYYKLDYPCPGEPALAERIANFLPTVNIPAKTTTKRPIDHGVWVPLKRLFPKADIPVVQITAPDTPQKNFTLGKTLIPLREKKNVLLAASGALSHNLRLAFAHKKNDPPDAWALELDSWLKEKLEKNDLESLLNYRQLAPHATLAAPTEEHFLPLFFFLGAAGKDPILAIHSSIRNGNGLMKILITGENQKNETPL